MRRGAYGLRALQSRQRVASDLVSMDARCVVEVIPGAPTSPHHLFVIPPGHHVRPEPSCANVVPGLPSLVELLQKCMQNDVGDLLEPGYAATKW